MASAIMDSPASAMPGSYIFRHDQQHNNAFSSSRSQSIFQPPTPSASPSVRSSQIPRPVSRSSNQQSNRKRPRLDTKPSYFSRPVRPSISNRPTVTSSSIETPTNLSGSYDHISLSGLSSSALSLNDLNIASPSPLANSDYRLAGGLDTPCASFEQSLDELAQDEAERDYRPNRYTISNASRTTLSANNSEIRYPKTPESSPPSSQTSRKRVRSRNDHVGSLTGWGIRSTAWALTGGLAGKVFNFCINTAFRGFSAGGGQPYHMDVGTPNVNASGFDQMSMRPDVFSDSYEKDHFLPGEYPHDLSGFVDDYMKSPESRRREREVTPTANHTNWGDRSTIKNDWEIINRINSYESDTEQSPVRKRSRASVAGTWQRPNSRGSTKSRTNVSGASYASPRARPSSGLLMNPPNAVGIAVPFQPVRRLRPSVSHSRRSTSNATSREGSGVGQASPDRPSSSASMRNPASGLSPEAVTYKRQIKEQDKNLKRVNSQVVDMIREAREALGSKVEIFDEYSGHDGDFDEGFYEAGWR